MANKRKKKEPEDLKFDGWLATFGDLVSLMLTFFVLLLSMSEIDTMALKAISAETIGEQNISVFGNGGGSNSIIPNIINRPLSREEQLLALRQRSKSSLSKTPLAASIKFPIIDKTPLIRIPSVVMFKPGEVSLSPAARSSFHHLSMELMANDEFIRIESYASPDETPGKFKTLQALSVERALSVMKFLASQGVKVQNMAISGYGAEKAIHNGRSSAQNTKSARIDILYKQ